MTQSCIRCFVVKCVRRLSEQCQYTLWGAQETGASELFFRHLNHIMATVQFVCVKPLAGSNDLLGNKPAVYEVIYSLSAFGNEQPALFPVFLLLK